MVKELNLDALFILADFAEAAAMANGAIGLPLIKLGDISQVDARSRMAQDLKDFVKEGDRILFKASHSVELNRVVEIFRR